VQNGHVGGGTSMSIPQPKLKLSSEPDGYGFFYGQLEDDKRFHNINVMPPASQWRGDFHLEGYEPHATDWVLHVDGEEVARVRRREDVETELSKVLLEG
jgi:hypothetical protein